MRKRTFPSWDEMLAEGSGGLTVGCAVRGQVITNPFRNEEGFWPVEPSHYGFRPLRQGALVLGLSLHDEEGYAVLITDGSGRPPLDGDGFWRMVGIDRASGGRIWSIEHHEDGSIVATDYWTDRDPGTGPLTQAEEQVCIPSTLKAATVKLLSSLADGRCCCLELRENNAAAYEAGALREVCTASALLATWNAL